MSSGPAVDGPFGAPVSDPLRPELPAPLPAEAHYRPRRRYLSTVYGSVAWVGLVVFFSIVRSGINARLLIGVAFVFLSLAGWSLMRRRGAPAWVKQNDDAAAMLASGQVAEAATEFESLARNGRAVPLLHSMFVFNRAVTFLREGRYDRALSLLSAVLRAGWSKDPRLATLHPLLLTEISTCFALLGKLDEADWWRRRSHDETSPAKLGKLVLLDALIDLRLSRFQQVADNIATHWQAAEGALNPTQMKTLRLLRAFALSRLERSEDRALDHHRMIEGAHPFRAGEFDYLVGAWPELRTFLQSEGFIA